MNSWCIRSGCTTSSRVNRSPPRLPGTGRCSRAAWGAPKFYLLSHIPGAGYIDTNEVESEPLWNKVSDAQLKAMLAKHGIRHDTTVILYGRDVYAAARVAQIMLYAGVKDVRLLDGGWKTWSDAGLRSSAERRRSRSPSRSSARRSRVSRS
ncbi:thiosulfate sulfurtransferase ynjE [Klebsiella michiganensis]|nr:thiosulfate sulfurtransferase ynjE [Klebsiella michiganensis]